jgi:hypothetical protein
MIVVSAMITIAEGMGDEHPAEFATLAPVAAPHTPSPVG